jgi:hypothetical protein
MDPQTQPALQHGKSMLIAIVSSVLVSALVFGGLGYYLGTNRSDSSSVSTPTSTSTPVTLTTTSALSSNIFDFTKSKVGDKFGELTVKTIEPFDKSLGAVSASNAKVTFTGETTVTGQYEYVDNSDGLGNLNDVCMTSLDTASLKKIALMPDQEDAYFCFSNQDLAKSKITSTPGAKGAATVMIKNYILVSFPEEHSKAELVSVVSKK